MNTCIISGISLSEEDIIFLKNISLHENISIEYYCPKRQKNFSDFNDFLPIAITFVLSNPLMPNAIYDMIKAVVLKVIAKLNKEDNAKIACSVNNDGKKYSFEFVKKGDNFTDDETQALGKIIIDALTSNG